MDEPLPLILFSGMGADQSIFAHQIQCFPQLIVPKWIEPLPHEPLTDYAKRFAALIDPARPCFVGGASFGGFIALEAARHLQTRACFLIGSVRAPSELPMRFRVMRKLKQFLPFLPFEWLSPLAECSVRLSGERMHPATRKIMEQLEKADAAYLRWACAAVLTWQPALPAVTPPFPIYQIHGKHDRVLPARRTHPDKIIPTGGHVLSLTRPHEVNRFLKEKICTLSETSDLSATTPQTQLSA
jgi:pimeloyl-ACP methyl ester carboxylesterase